MIVRAAPPKHYAWLLQRMSFIPSLGLRAIEAVDTQGRILGMLGYDLWTPTSVHMHVALDSPIAARVLRGPALEYPFIQCDKRMVLGMIALNNVRSLRLAQHFGFREVYCAPGDFVLVELCRDDWQKGRTR